MTNKLHNPGLYKHLKAATKEASDLLHDIKSNADIESGIYYQDRIAVNDEIVVGTSFKSCVQFLMEDLSMDRLKNIQEPEERRGEIRSTILHYIKKYLGSPRQEYEFSNALPGQVIQKLKEFNEQTFNEFYGEYEQYLYSNKPMKYLIVVGLEGLYYVSSSPVIKLSDDTRLIDNEESCYFDAVMYDERLQPSDPTITPIGVYDPPGPGLWLEIDYEIEKEKVPLEMREYIEHVSLETIKKVFRFLRLYKEGDFKLSVVYWCPKTYCEVPHSHEDILFFNGNYESPNRYILEEDDVKKIQLLLEKCTNNSNQKGFPHSAIYYLDNGVRDDDIPDRLVNYTAALESLFVDGKEGISTLLAHRTAFFLEKDRQKCKEIYNDIKKAYGFRSNIVHGDHHKIKDELELKEYCNKTESYARRAIIQWINMIDEGKNRQEIYDSIEENLFS